MPPRPWLLDSPITPEEASEVDKSAVARIVASVFARPTLKINEIELGCHLERAKAYYHTNFPGFTKRDHDELEQLSKQVTKTRKSLKNIDRDESKAFALLSATAASEKIVRDLVRELSGNLVLVEGLLARCRKAREEYRPTQEPGLLNESDVLGWFVTRGPYTAPDRAHTLIGCHLPAIYEHHFRKEFGLSRSASKKIGGPGFRFIQASLNELSITQQTGQPYQPEGIRQILRDSKAKSDG